MNKNKTRKISRKTSIIKYSPVDYSHLLGKVKGIDNNLMKIHFKLYEGLVGATNGALMAFRAASKNGVIDMVAYSAIQK